MSTRTVKPAYAAGVALLAAAATVTGCVPPSPSPPPGSSPVNVTAQYTFASGGAPTCSGSLTWTYTPLSLTGHSGRAGQIVDPETYTNVPARGSDCVLGSGELGLRQGTWRIQADDHGDPAGNCVVTLTADTTVTIQQGIAGCTTFP